MDRLQAQDSGVYWCALYNPSQRPAFTRIMEVRLSVDKSLPARTPEAEMSQREGSTFSIECPYATQPGDKQPKAWCRVRNARCELVVWTLASTQYRYSDKARQGHITIQDDNRTVSITMSHLQAEDSGIYSCVYSSNYVPLKTISLNVYKGEYYFFPHKLTSCQRTTLLLPRSILLGRGFKLEKAKEKTPL
ncbi:trem-like transcript 4 protein [Meleagris gallopavo]|uniref:trem-like transcript 4 protein n=1 Tax=Meleagris gallopavo TaxID=9103 RepID=UPI00093D1A50|nr:trem-like transcript 4 protein [Meleagris gallopavo]